LEWKLKNEIRFELISEIFIFKKILLNLTKRGAIIKKLLTIFLSFLAILSFGIPTVLSEDCVSMVVSKDILYVGDTFTVAPNYIEIASHFSTGDVDIVSIEGNYTVYEAKCSGTVVFMNCDEVTTVKIFPNETPFGAFLKLIRFRNR